MDPQSLMLSSVIANHTKNLKIGTSIHRPTLRLPGGTLSPRALPHERYAFDNLQPEDPFQVAEQVAIVEQISEGRFIYEQGPALAALPSAGNTFSSTSNCSSSCGKRTDFPVSRASTSIIPRSTRAT